MKLGSETGSLVNHLMSRGTRGQPEPVVGMGATMLSWSDRHPATIIAVEKDKQGRWLITTQADHYDRVDGNGMSESQTYEYSPNPNGFKQLWRFEENRGGWRAVARTDKGRLVLTGSGSGLRIGQREKYHDFSF